MKQHDRKMKITKYALSEKGANAMVRAFAAVTISNLVLMLPVGLLYQLASYLLENRVPKDKLAFFIIGIIVTLLLIVISTSFQYNSTFYSTYVESGVRRRTLGRKAEKAPAFFLWQEGSCRFDKYDHVRLCIDRDGKLTLDS